jgi:hypothetical protein
VKGWSAITRLHGAASQKTFSAGYLLRVCRRMNQASCCFCDRGGKPSAGACHLPQFQPNLALLVNRSRASSLVQSASHLLQIMATYRTQPPHLPLYPGIFKLKQQECAILHPRIHWIYYIPLCYPVEWRIITHVKTSSVTYYTMENIIHIVMSSFMIFWWRLWLFWYI